MYIQIYLFIYLFIYYEKKNIFFEGKSSLYLFINLFFLKKKKKKEKKRNSFCLKV